MKHLRLLATSLTVLAFAGSLAQAQGRGNDKDKQRDQQKDEHGRVSPAEQQRRARDEEERTTQYRRDLDEQVRIAEQHTARLSEEKRTAQYRAQQDYAAQLRQQQERLRTTRDYRNDPYVSTPHSYEFRVHGIDRQTNQYGVGVLRQAVNFGYQQGVRAGEADRMDHRRSSYASTLGFRDANFGYEGRYVEQGDYNYYFREGFRRGYEDGYDAHWRYGSNANGTFTIIGSLLDGILGLRPIR